MATKASDDDRHEFATPVNAAIDVGEDFWWTTVRATAWAGCASRL